MKEKLPEVLKYRPPLHSGDVSSEKGSAGGGKFEPILQESLNPGIKIRRKRSFFGTLFRLGDK